MPTLPYFDPVQYAQGYTPVKYLHFYKAVTWQDVGLSPVETFKADEDDLRAKLIKHLDCSFHIKHIHKASWKDSTHAFLILKCHSFKCSNKCRKRGDAELKLTANQLCGFSIYNSSSLLSPLTAGFCHKCGGYSADCFTSLAEHAICRKCLLGRNTKPPYPYGFGAEACCTAHNCGSKALPYADEEGEAVLRAALESYGRHKSAV